MGSWLLSADAARKMTEENNKCEERVNALVSHACRKIKDAAERGEYAIYDPFRGVRLLSTDYDKKEAKQTLAALGYKVAMTESDQLMVSWRQEKNDG